MKTYFVRKSRSFHTCDISRNEHWLIVHRCIRYLETQLIFIVERVISKEYRQLLFYRAILSSISFFFFFTIEQMVSNTKFVKAILSNILRNTYLFF